MDFRGVLTMLAAAALGAIAPVFAPTGFLSQASAQEAFPFGREMQLVTAPMAGSRRIPGLDIGGQGEVTIDLWCVQMRGQFVVAGETLTVVTGAPVSAVPSCTPERAAADDALLAQLGAVTGWRMQGQDLVLAGPKPLRFRFNTN